MIEINKSLLGRNSGSYKFIEANIVGKTHDLDKAHFIVSQIEKNIKEKIKNADQVLIHFEPTKKRESHICHALEDVEQQRISPHFGEAPYFVLITIKAKDKKYVEHKIIENPSTKIEARQGDLGAEYLNKHSVDLLLTRKTFKGKGPSYVFSYAAIEVLLTEEETVKKDCKASELSLKVLKQKVKTSRWRVYEYASSLYLTRTETFYNHL